MNIFKLLKKLNLPVAYGAFKNKVDAPYIVYLGSGNENFKADNKVYNSQKNYRIEYYYKLKDEEKEEEIEKIFNDNEIIWEKSEDIYISDEKLYMINYYI